MFICRKTRYPSRKIAKRYLKIYWRDNPQVPFLRVYECPNCCCWHFTSQKNKFKK